MDNTPDQPKRLTLTISAINRDQRLEITRGGAFLNEMTELGRTIVKDPAFGFTKYIIEIYYFTSNMDKVTLFERRV